MAQWDINLSSPQGEGKKGVVNLSWVGSACILHILTLNLQIEPDPSVTIIVRLTSNPSLRQQPAQNFAGLFAFVMSTTSST